MKLLTLADGFGDSGAYPLWYSDYYKWPELIQLMTAGVELVNLSRYGAGNEYIVECLKNNMIGKDHVIIQWAQPHRLDLLLAHNEYKNFWSDAVSQDASYSKNVVNNYWITSASKNPAVQEYHKKYISIEQHCRRSRLYMDYARLLLTSNNVNFNFMLTADSKYLADQPTDHHWLWHSPWAGMESFRTLSQYTNLDFGYTQPIPLIQFDYIQQYIVPNTTLPWRSSQELKAVESMLHRKYKEAIINKPI
jgi:hypothetical protein